VEGAIILREGDAMCEEGGRRSALIENILLIENLLRRGSLDSMYDCRKIGSGNLSR
jgi:hypothetical protein